MALTFAVESLRSRTTSAAIQAKRTASTALKGAKGWLAKLAKMGGWLVGKIVKYFNLDFSRLWDMIVQGYFALKYFDWNATDEALNKQMEANNKRIAVAAAQTIGTYLGWGAVRLANFFLGRFLGSKAKQTAAKIKVPVLSARVGLALAEEGNEEVASEVRRFLSVTAGAQISNGFIAFILAARKNHWFGLESITKPQSNGSIAQKIEEKIEKLPEFWRQPVEELIESFEEAIVEAGYVISYTIDDHVAAMRYATQTSQGPDRTIEITPEGSEEKLVFAGPQTQLEQAIRSTVMGTYPLIENRDLGLINGAPVDEQIKMENQLRKITLLYCEHAKPPFNRRKNGVFENGTRMIISIPDAKPGITWKELKSVCRPISRGNVFVSCKMKNGRQMNGWFSTANEGIKTLTELAREFSSQPIIPDSFRYSTSDSANGRKERKRMYLVRAALLYPKRRNKENFGPRGTSQHMAMWQDEEPANTKPFV